VCVCEYVFFAMAPNNKRAASEQNEEIKEKEVVDEEEYEAEKERESVKHLWGDKLIFFNYFLPSLFIDVDANRRTTLSDLHVNDLSRRTIKTFVHKLHINLSEAE
jgi:hypothetical protein